MKKLVSIVAAGVLCGCAVTEAEWGGEEIVKDVDGNPLVVSGAVQKIKQPVRLYSNRHWFDSRIDQASLEVDGQRIEFTLNGYTGMCSSNAVAYVDTCLRGVATITGKIVAAVATSGGSLAGEGASAAISAVASKFIGRGGDAEQATVTCEGGNCKVTDGTITEICEGCCAGGRCSE